jgi:hypothetical protein
VAQRRPPVRLHEVGSAVRWDDPCRDVERVIEGAEQAQREDAGFGEQIATKRFGVKESDADRRDDE